MNNQPIVNDGFAQLVGAIRAALRDDLLREIRAELRAVAAEPAPERVMLSIADCQARYGIGRSNLRKMISAGKLRAVVRPARGGREGQFVHLADAERVLAGRKISI